MFWDQNIKKMTLKKREFWPEVYGNFEIKIFLSKKVINSLPQAPFWQKNNEKYMTNHGKIRKKWFFINKCHLFFAAGAFLSKNECKKHEGKYRGKVRKHENHE